MKKKIIIIEGIDGCGKDFVKDSLQSFLGDEVKCLREPDGYMRDILKNKAIKKSFMDEFIAMWISRFVLWINEILNSQYEYFVISRSYPSTFAYQIEGRGLKEYEDSFRFWKRRLLEMFKVDTVEFHHVYLRTDVSVSLSRIEKRNDSDGLEYFEEENFLKRTKSGYDCYYNDKCNLSENEYLHVIDANKTKPEVWAQVMQVLSL